MTRIDANGGMGAMDLGRVADQTANAFRNALGNEGGIQREMTTTTSTANGAMSLTMSVSITVSSTAQQVGQQAQAAHQHVCGCNHTNTQPFNGAAQQMGGVVNQLGNTMQQVENQLGGANQGGGMIGQLKTLINLMNTLATMVQTLQNNAFAQAQAGATPNAGGINMAANQLTQLMDMLTRIQGGMDQIQGGAGAQGGAAAGGNVADMAAGGGQIAHHHNLALHAPSVQYTMAPGHVPDMAQGIPANNTPANAPLPDMTGQVGADQLLAAQNNGQAAITDGPLAGAQIVFNAELNINIIIQGGVEIGCCHCAQPPAPEVEGEVAVDEGRIWGDPHFVGADGGKYDVQGEAGKTYNILSDTGVQMNASFKEWNNPGTTVVDQVGISTANGPIQINSDGSMVLQGDMAIAPGQEGTYMDGAVVVNHEGHITVNAGEYQITFDNFASNAKSGDWINNIEIRSEDANSDHVLPGGLWGVTVDGDGVARDGDRGKGTQGGGALEGLDGTITEKGDTDTVGLYEVGGLFDTTFDNFNLFTQGDANNANTFGFDPNVAADLTDLVDPAAIQAALTDGMANIGAGDLAGLRIQFDATLNINIVFDGNIPVGTCACEAPAVPQEPNLDDLQEVNDGGKWIASHGGYEKNDDGSFTITQGEHAGCRLEWNVEAGFFLVFNAEGTLIGKHEGREDKIASPIAFDMNGDGEIGVTGDTTAKDGVRLGMGETIQFDIDGDGDKENIEWMAGDGDALLVDNRDGNAANDMDGNRLFGDLGGKFNDGFEKLRELDANGDLQITEDELEGLSLWADNGDGVVQEGELVDASEAGVTRISAERNDVTNAAGETLMRSDADIAGETVMTEDVWFGEDA